MIKSTRDISQNMIKAINDNSEKIINILTSIKVNINNPMNNNNITYNNWCDNKGQDIDAKEKKSIFLSNINRNNRSSKGNKNINFRQINSSNYSIPKRNTLKQNKNNFKEAQKTIYNIYNNYTFSLNQKEQKKNIFRNNTFLPKYSTTISKKKKNYSVQGKKEQINY